MDRPPNGWNTLTMPSRSKRVMSIVLVCLTVLAALAVSASTYLGRPAFGQTPEGDALRAILASPNQVNGVFENPVPTPMFRKGESFARVLWQNLTSRPERLAPTQALPSVKQDLNALPLEQDTLVWLGHSSYYLHLAGQRILIDPVFSAYAAPVSFANLAFAGSTPYTAEDMPPIDLLLITHDHWDHLDHDTLTALMPKVRQVVTGLGVGSHLRAWGYASSLVREGDWMDSFPVTAQLSVHVLPARHYSGRALQRNRTLWVAFALVSPDRRWFFSGDSGYGTHFRQIGERFQGFDLVALDSGQYDDRWPLIHMTPEKAAQAAEDLKAQYLLPAHVGRFAMAQHAWDEPLQRIKATSQGRPFHLLTPVIGVAVEFDHGAPASTAWWEATQ